MSWASGLQNMLHRNMPRQVQVFFAFVVNGIIEHTVGQLPRCNSVCPLRLQALTSAVSLSRGRLFVMKPHRLGRQPCSGLCLPPPPPHAPSFSRPPALLPVDPIATFWARSQSICARRAAAHAPRRQGGARATAEHRAPGWCHVGAAQFHVTARRRCSCAAHSAVALALGRRRREGERRHPCDRSGSDARGHGIPPHEARELGPARHRTRPTGIISTAAGVRGCARHMSHIRARARAGTHAPTHPRTLAHTCAWPR